MSLADPGLFHWNGRKFFGCARGARDLLDFSPVAPNATSFMVDAVLVFVT